MRYPKRIAARFAALLLAAGCSASPEAAPAPSVEPAGPAEPLSAVEPWQPVDPAFAGCAGACGAGVHGPQPGVVHQPAQVGDETYCPVSGAVFRIEETHPHREVAGARLYFCCEGCATFFDAQRERVLSARPALAGRS